MRENVEKGVVQKTDLAEGYVRCEKCGTIYPERMKECPFCRGDPEGRLGGYYLS